LLLARCAFVASASKPFRVGYADAVRARLSTESATLCHPIVNPGSIEPEDTAVWVLRTLAAPCPLARRSFIVRASKASLAALPSSSNQASRPRHRGHQHIAVNDLIGDHNKAVRPFKTRDEFELFPLYPTSSFRCSASAESQVIHPS
jgi:hypothetical protein